MSSVVVDAVLRHDLNERVLRLRVEAGVPALLVLEAAHGRRVPDHDAEEVAVDRVHEHGVDVGTGRNALAA